jgi:hypothetical protein
MPNEYSWSMTHATTKLGRITAPIRLLWGDKDVLFSRAEQDRFLAAAAARDAHGLQGDGTLPELGKTRRRRGGSRGVSVNHGWIGCREQPLRFLDPLVLQVA